MRYGSWPSRANPASDAAEESRRKVQLLGLSKPLKYTIAFRLGSRLWRVEGMSANHSALAFGSAGFLVQLVTGVILAMYYKPDPDKE